MTAARELRMPAQLLIEGGIGGALIVGTDYRVTEIRGHIEPSGVKGVPGRETTVIRFDPVLDEQAALREALREVTRWPSTRRPNDSLIAVRQFARAALGGTECICPPEDAGHRRDCPQWDPDLARHLMLSADPEY